MKKTYRRILGGILLVVIGSLVLTGGCLAGNTTEIGVDAYELTINVDQTIASWGYQVKVGNDDPVTPVGQTYKALFTGKNTTTVQILVRPGQGLPADWYLTAVPVYCTATIPGNQNRVDVTSFTQKTASVTITAHNDTLYTVTFDADGGTPEPESQTVAYGQKVEKPDNPAKTGYTFEGWYYGSDKWDFNNDVVESDMTLTAHWTAITYKVRFNQNGGSGTQMNDQEFTYDVAQNLSANTYTKTGYTFAGWATSAEGAVEYADQQSVSNLADTQGAVVNLYAKWTPVTYKVRFNGNGADSGSPMSDQEFTYDAAQNLSANTYAKTGHTFAGWATSAVGSVEYSDGEEVINLASTQGVVVNLYAKWTPVTYKVHFDKNGGSGTQMSDQEFTYDVAQNLSANTYTKMGYAFAGWATSAEGSVVYADQQPVINLADTQGAVVNLYAKWTSVTYTVIFDANGGSGSMENQIILVDTPTPLDTNTFSRDGYTFIGWNTDKTAATALYTDEQEVTNLTSAGSSITLYAVWTPNTYSVHFNKNGGSGTQMTDQTFTYDAAQKLTKNTYTAPEGKKFAGWSETPTGSVEYIDEQFVKNLTTVPGAVVDLYAVWSIKPKEYWIVSFDANGGTGTMADISVEKGTSFVVPENEFTAPEGTDFKEWLIDGTTVVLQPGDICTPTGNLTLVAQWQPLEYWKLTFDANGGTGSMNPVYVVKGSYTYLPKNEFTAPSNSTFNGWYIHGEIYAVGEKYTPTADTVVYAVWKSTGGGSSGGGSVVTCCLVEFETFTPQEIEDQYLREGSLVKRPDDPVNPGFVFGGWYTFKGKEWNFDTDRVHYSMTLYAKWIYVDTPVTPVEPVTPAETPFPLLGILAGIGAAGVLLIRRK